MNEAIIEKLKKILARASEGRGASEAEMQTAMAMAQKLAVENNIDLASIQLEDGKGDIEIERVDVSSERSDGKRPHHHGIWMVLMECFEVQLILLGGSKFAMVGEKTDVALATFCFHWLDKLYLSSFREWDKNSDMLYPEAMRRRGYYRGLTNGIIENNQHAKKEAVETAKAMSSSAATSYELVVVKKEEAIKARYEEEFPHVRKGRSQHGAIDPEARAAGYSKGSTIKLGAQIS
jgi:hypothetical protein